MCTGIEPICGLMSSYFLIRSCESARFFKNESSRKGQICQKASPKKMRNIPDIRFPKRAEEHLGRQLFNSAIKAGCTFWMSGGGSNGAASLGGISNLDNRSPQRMQGATAGTRCFSNPTAEKLHLSLRLVVVIELFRVAG